MPTKQGRGDNVGGVWEIQPGATTWIARSIAVAAAHPLGVGDAMYRLAATASEVDTVPFGSFRRTLIEQIGGYNESLLTNEDYEFNTRIRQANGRVWLDPSIRSVYFARSTFKELVRQYWRYGYWKWRMLRHFPDTVRWRQALPPLFVLSLVCLLLFRSFFHLHGGFCLRNSFFIFPCFFLQEFHAVNQTTEILPAAGPAPGNRCHARLLGQRVSLEYAHLRQEQIRMADHVRTTPLRLRPNEHRAILFAGDLLMALASVFLALYTWSQYNQYSYELLYEQYIAQGIGPRFAQQLAEGQTIFEPQFWFYLLPIIWVLLLVELYEPHTAASARKTIRGIAIAAFIGLLAYSVVFIIQQESNLPRIGVGAFLVYASGLTLLWRMLFIRMYKSTGQRRRMIVLGAGKAGQTLAELYNKLDTRSFNIIGFVDDDRHKVGRDFYGVKVLATSAQLLNLVDAYRISDLVVAINGEIEGTTFQTILDAQERGVDVTRMPLLYEEMTSRVPVHHLESDWIIRSFVDGLHVSGIYELSKRLLDIIGALFGLVIFVDFASLPGAGDLAGYRQADLLFPGSSRQRRDEIQDL